MINLQTPAEIIPNEDVIKYDLDKTIKLGDSISLQGGITKDQFERISEKQTNEFKKIIKSMPQNIIRPDGSLKTKIINNNKITYLENRYS